MKIIKLILVCFFILISNGCATLSQEGSYYDFRDNMTDEKALNYYNAEGLCRLKQSHFSFTRGPYTSTSDSNWILVNKRILTLLEKKNAFTDDEITLISNRQIKRGISELAAYCSIGFPIRKNSSNGSWGTNTQAVISDKIYLYITNGKLNSWQFSN